MPACRIVPPFLLERLAAYPDPPAGPLGRRTLEIDAELRRRRATAPRSPAQGDSPFSIHTADNGSVLPGALVRAAGDPVSGDLAVDEAYIGVEASLALFAEVYGRSSYDGKGAPVIATVHYETNYDNAFWDGSQLVFGDGDGVVFDRFTKPVDVLGHELSHAVTQYTADLAYSGQPGALNESVSDVFGSCLKQRLLAQAAVDADWLIGEGIFLPSVQGRALRSMKEPGTAYDDPRIGRDPQVGSMDDYVETTEDNGGVHINSGIPNRAFYLAATGIGGNSWDGAGRIWYAALTSGIGGDTDFAGFAAATVSAATDTSVEAVNAVRTAWSRVGVAVPGSAATSSVTGASAGSAGGSSETVAVVRSGGFAGIRQTGQLTLGDDPRTPEVESLLGRIDLRSVTTHEPQPDRFVYTFHLRGEEVVVGKPDLTPDLRQLAGLLLPGR